MKDQAIWIKLNQLFSPENKASFEEKAKMRDEILHELNQKGREVAKKHNVKFRAFTAEDLVKNYMNYGGKVC